MGKVEVKLFLQFAVALFLMSQNNSKPLNGGKSKEVLRTVLRKITEHRTKKALFVVIVILSFFDFARSLIQKSATWCSFFSLSIVNLEKWSWLKQNKKWSGYLQGIEEQFHLCSFAGCVFRLNLSQLADRIFTTEWKNACGHTAVHHRPVQNVITKQDKNQTEQEITMEEAVEEMIPNLFRVFLFCWKSIFCLCLIDFFFCTTCPEQYCSAARQN